MKDIAVIIINFNTSVYTLKCVEKVFEKTNPKISFEIVVVDNNSEKKDFEHLSKNLRKAENVTLIKSEINTGFGGGNNLGFSHSDSKYILFLNNDAFLINDCLQLAINFMEENPQAGIAGAQNYDEHNQFVSSFDHDKGLRKLLFGRSFLQKLNPEKYPCVKTDYTSPVCVNWVNGAFLFMASEDFKKVGKFDPEIFLYFEEMDLSQRMRKINKKTFLFPEAKIMHYQGKSTGKNHLLAQEGLISFLYVLKKNKGIFKHVLIRLYFILTFAFKPKKWRFLKIVLSPNPKKFSLRPKIS